MSRTLSINIAGRTLTPTPVFETYWKFASRRQALYESRLFGSAPPWTDDPILREYRFTNVFRAADRVSQHLIRDVIYGERATDALEDCVFRVLLFKIFNKPATWNALESSLEQITWQGYDHDRYAAALDRAAERGPIYSPAYVVPPPRLGEATKRRNHLRLLEHIMDGDLPRLVAADAGLDEIYRSLARTPSIGPFLAFQFTIDLNYTPLISADENEFVVPGPGALDGIRKCFGVESRGVETEIIRYMTDHQEEWFERLALPFDGLFGRPLHLIDCQNLFCEVDKYARVAHPEVAGVSGRQRIKQRFRPAAHGRPPVFPPKWGLSVPAAAMPEPVELQARLFDVVEEHHGARVEVELDRSGVASS